MQAISSTKNRKKKKKKRQLEKRHNNKSIYFSLEVNDDDPFHGRASCNLLCHAQCIGAALFAIQGPLFHAYNADKANITRGFLRIFRPAVREFPISSTPQ